jgi:aminoglycoside phosphotransferase (APT) family kinase protein
VLREFSPVSGLSADDGLGRAPASAWRDTLPAVTDDIRRPGVLIATGRTAEVYAWGDDRVVKVLRRGFPHELGEAEARAAGLADRAGIGAPAFFGPTRVEGRFGLMYERIDGDSMMARLVARPWSVGRHAAVLGRLHAGMHQASGDPLPPFRDRFVAAVTGAARYAGEAASAALARVEALRDGSALCHGDFHPGNVMMSASGPRVIDWLDASCGPPAADVARTLFLLRDGRLPRDLPLTRRLRITLLRRRFVAGYLAAYGRRWPLDLDEVRAWRLPILVARLDEDIPEERDHLRRLIGEEVERARLGRV